MKTSQHHFQEQGYVYLPQLIPRSMALYLCEKVNQTIQYCAQDLQVSSRDYLTAVSRWRNPSCVTNCVDSDLIEHIRTTLCNLFKENLFLNRINIISKNANSYENTPCHQDIAYSPHDPYFCSVWLALQDIPLAAGPIRLLPKSHLGPIHPAIDFWHHDFVDRVRQSYQWQLHSKTFQFKAGDALIFDACLWHGSDDNILKQDRYVLVTRWSYHDFVPPAIPSLPVKPFGMWTWGAMALEMLRVHYQIIGKNSLPYDNLIERWRTGLLDHFIPGIDSNRARQDLHYLHILNEACDKHNGGDSLGKIYKQLWHSLFKHLGSEL